MKFDTPDLLVSSEFSTKPQEHQIQDHSLKSLCLSTIIRIMSSTDNDLSNCYHLNLKYVERDCSHDCDHGPGVSISNRFSETQCSLQSPIGVKFIDIQSDITTKEDIKEQDQCSQPSKFSCDLLEYMPYNTSGGCFGADTMVCVLGETEKAMPAKDIVKGTRVLTDKGASTVECVVKLKYSGIMHSIGQCVHLTSYHPLYFQDQCYYAKELSYRTGVYSRFTLQNEYVYDYVLSNRGLLCCSYMLSQESTGTKLLHAATFGHTCKLEKFAHPYFGSEAVVEDLKRNRPTAYAEGLIVLDSYVYERCEKSQQVTGMTDTSV